LASAEEQVVAAKALAVVRVQARAVVAPEEDWELVEVESVEGVTDRHLIR
jgi:hypothetical protein